MEGILSALSKEREGTTMASCIVLSTMWGYDLTASETFIALIPLTTLNLLNHFKSIFTSFALSTLTVYFAMTNHLVSTVLFVADTESRILYEVLTSSFKKLTCTLWGPL